MKSCIYPEHVGDSLLDFSHFHANARTKDGYHYYCKRCMSVFNKLNRKKNKANWTSTQQRYYGEHRDRIISRACVHQQINRERTNEISREYRKNNNEQRKRTTKKWRDKNKELTCFLANKRRAQKLSATPLWYPQEEERIKQLYQQCARITESTGIVYHVDHIIPLQSNIVCGLHCLSNLRIITQSENNQKCNKLIDTPT